MSTTTPPLSRTMIADAALHLSRTSEGRPWDDVVTMRRLAVALGCSTMAAYRHVDTRRDVTHLAIARALELLPTNNRIMARDAAGAWRADSAAAELAYVLHVALGDYPGLAAHVPDTIPKVWDTLPNERHLAPVVLGAIHAADHTATLLLGLVRGLHPDTDRDLARIAFRRLAGLDDDA